MVRPRRALPLLLACVLPAAPAGAALVINEVYFDPPGPDAGAEWVELYNSGPSAAPLEGVALESGNGSGPGQWRRFWAGTAGDWIEPAGCFVIGGPYRGRAPDAPARCDLQNGPDGVRLRREGWELDRVGWGDHDWPEYFEGTPAPVPQSGSSLARVEDAVDSDDNARDFAAMEPSPGRRNRPRVDLALSIGAMGRPFPLPAGSTGARACARVRNRGRDPVPLDAVQLLLDGRMLEIGAPTPERSFFPGDSLVWELRLVPRGDGPVHEWPVEVRHPADEDPGNDRDTLRLRAWPPPVRISEIAPRPESGGTEWIELCISAPEPVSLEGWRLEDAAGIALRLTETRPAEPGEFHLLRSDPSAILEASPSARWPSWSGSWPSLNDAAGKDGAADTLWLRDPAGLVADWAVWGEARRGETWIRGTDEGEAQGLDAWFAIAATRATAGGANPEIRARLAPRTVRTAPAGVSFSRYPDGMWLRLPEIDPSEAWCLRIFDLSGREVWRREGRGQPGGSRWVRWDGRDAGGEVPAGFVLVELRRQDAVGLASASRQPLWVSR